ncbi:MAG: TraR/DksA C4-type zinc finger protein [Candidatus Marinimicrobia bacterium]|nr:TraR/DksA C4-type zinc finger protein [Candidatus Neomarinimicrobiota bacterium]
MAKKSWTKKELKEFRKVILEKRVGAQEAIERSKELTDNIVETGDVTNAVYSSHMADAGSDQQDREKAYYWLDRERKFLQYLNRALDMIDDGTFGICKTCSGLIGKERLMEVPHTSTCYECKSKDH